MKRNTWMLAVVIVVLVASVVTFSGCEKGDSGKTTTGSRVENGNNGTNDSEPDDTVSTEKNRVAVFFLKGENLVSYEREVKGGAPEALKELLGGLTQGEKAQGAETVIPEGVQVNSYKVEGDAAKVDFSGELRNYGGGSARVQAIISQITRTVLENDPSVKSVAITVDGVPSEESLQP